MSVQHGGRNKAFLGALLVLGVLMLALVPQYVEGSELVTPHYIGEPDAPIEITVGLEVSYGHQYDVQSRKDYLYERMESWARMNKNVKVVPVIYSADDSETYARLLEQSARGRAPDIAMLDGQFAPRFFDRMQPIDDYLTEQEINDWFDWALEGAMIDPADGRLKALWLTTNAVGLWYRKDLIPEPPRTWDELMEVAKRMQTEHGYQYGLLVRGSGEQIPYGSVLPQFYALGGKLVDETGAPVFGDSPNREALVDVFTFWKQAIDEGVVPIKVLDIRATGDMLAEVAAGNVAMVLEGSWAVSGLEDVLGADIDNWDFTYTPHRDGQLKQVVGGYTFGVFTDEPEKIALALDFVRYVYAGADGMARWSAAAGYSPVRKSVYEDYAFFREDKWQQRFGNVIAVGQTRPGVVTYPVISQALQTAFEEVILGLSTPEKAVDQAWEYVLRETR